jgi:hypothetical protein
MSRRKIRFYRLKICSATIFRLLLNCKSWKILEEKGILGWKNVKGYLVFDLLVNNYRLIVKKHYGMVCWICPHFFEVFIAWTLLSETTPARHIFFLSWSRNFKCHYNLNDYYFSNKLKSILWGDYSNKFEQIFSLWLYFITCFKIL